MDPASYAALTAELAARLERDDRVLGLVLLGSTVLGGDEWADHDFFVVTRPGVQEELRTDLSWLPETVELVLAFRETEHGLKLLARNGHLLELAVFDLEEIAVTRVNRYRVVIDRGGVAARMAEVAALGPPTQPPLDYHLAQVVTCALVGALRARRGEVLSGAFFVVTIALRHLLELVVAALPAGDPTVLDDLDPYRRFERAYPELGGELAALLREPADVAALGLLELADRVVRPVHPELQWDALEVVRARLRTK